MSKRRRRATLLGVPMLLTVAALAVPGVADALPAVLRQGSHHVHRTRHDDGQNGPGCATGADPGGEGGSAGDRHTTAGGDLVIGLSGAARSAPVTGLTVGSRSTGGGGSTDGPGPSEPGGPADCGTPPPQLPEVGLAGLLPLSGAASVTGALWWTRRSRRRPRHARRRKLTS